LALSRRLAGRFHRYLFDLPIFPVSTPQAFYELLLASASKDPNAMKTFAAVHPEIAAFGAWSKSAP
jgi:catalase